MKKLRLSLEELAVESFTTQRDAPVRGTVAGNQTTGVQIICDCPTNGYENTCRDCSNSCLGTCEASCNGTCDASCNGTCDGCTETVDDWTCRGTCDCSVPPQIIC